MRWTSGCRSRSGARPERRAQAWRAPPPRRAAASIPGIAFAHAPHRTIQRARSESLHAFASNGLLALIGGHDHTLERVEIAARHALRAAKIQLPRRLAENFRTRSISRHGIHQPIHRRRISELAL